MRGVGPRTRPDGDGPAEDSDAETDRFGDSPVEVREKVHRSTPMTLDQALAEMELVGHDFYLFHDSETDRASVLYRRRGWSYGVIHLDLDGEAGDDAESPVTRSMAVAASGT